MARPAIAKRKYPTARVGNYEAPVDTAGMDEAMKQTMGLSAKPKPKKAGFDWKKFLGAK